MIILLFPLQLTLEDNSGVKVMKKGGVRVLRARITKQSGLVGCTAEEVKFRENYKAAIVAVQQGGKYVIQSLMSLKFGVGEILILQVSDDFLLVSSPSNTVSKARRFSLFSSARGVDENKPPDVTEHVDAERGRRDSNLASSYVVCMFYINCLLVWLIQVLIAF